jgi:outer membrane protein assembly factor BamD (BamD/ComL family)
LRAGRFVEAGDSFEAATQLLPTGVYVAQALAGLARAREAAGDVEAAAVARERLRSEYPHTPWAELPE